MLYDDVDGVALPYFGGSPLVGEHNDALSVAQFLLG